jgi:hypothetical protein
MPIVSLLIIALLAFPSQRDCSCRNALDSDRPNGANEVVEFRGQTVKRVAGQIFKPNDNPATDVVVELYDLSGVDPNLASYEIVGLHPRRLACVTDTTGAFCFSDLPTGKYLLRAGTRTPNGMNELYARVTVDRRWLTGLLRRSKPINLTLTLGT